MYDYEFVLPNVIPGFDENKTLEDKMVALSDYCSERGRKGHRLHTAEYNNNGFLRHLIFEVPVQSEGGEVWGM